MPGTHRSHRRFLKEPAECRSRPRCFYWEKSWLERRLEAASRTRSRRGAGRLEEAGLRPVGLGSRQQGPSAASSGGDPGGQVRRVEPSTQRAWACGRRGLTPMSVRVNDAIGTVALDILCHPHPAGLLLHPQRLVLKSSAGEGRALGRGEWRGGGRRRAGRREGTGQGV